MKKLALLVGLALVGVLAYYLLYSKRSKPHGDEVKEPVAVAARWPLPFTDSLKSVMENYFALSEAFVAWDTAAIEGKSALLQQSLANLKLDELKKDTLIYETANSYLAVVGEELNKMNAAPGITDKRRAFAAASGAIYDLLRTTQYEGGTVYLQECPMAFNDNETASWLSKVPELRNPYLGLHHPKYRSGMLECGETKDSISFRPGGQF